MKISACALVIQLLLAICPKGSAAMIPLKFGNVAQDLRNTIEKIVTEQLTEQRVLPVVADEKFKFLIGDILRSLQSTFYQPMIVMVNEVETLSNHITTSISSPIHPSQQFLLLVKNEYSFNNSLTILSNSNLWNSRAKFLVILEDINPQSIRNFFEISFQRHVTNIVVATKFGFQNDVDIIRSSMYTYYPYMENTCADLRNAVTIHHDQIGDFIDGQSLYSSKEDNLHGCPLRICTFNFPPMTILKKSSDGKLSVDGYEGKILQTVAKVMNFTPIISTPTDGLLWGHVFQNGTATGLVGDIVHGRADIGFVNLILNQDRYFVLDITRMYNMGCFTWLVPKAQFFPQWMNLLLHFTLELWILLSASTVLTAITLAMMNKAIVWNKKDSSISETILAAISILFWISVAKQPKEISRRVIFLTFTWFCFVMISALTSGLAAHLTIPRRKPDISTYPDLLESGLTYGGAPNMPILLAHTLDKDLKKIVSRYVPDYNFNALKAVDRVALKRDFAVWLSKEGLTYIAWKKGYLAGEKGPLVHLLPHCSLTHSIHAYLVKDSPFLSKYNIIIVRLLESGLIREWIENLTGSNTEVGETAVEEVTAKITLNHLKGPFIILLVGLSTGVLIFIFCHIKQIVVR